MTATSIESGAAQTFFDPYAHHGIALPHEEPVTQSHGGHLPPPDPAQRFNLMVGPRDRRRLDLHAALTSAGVPPQCNDREAIDHLSDLPDSVSDCVQRWIQHATRNWPPVS
ncbi:hypothetical protein [Streptomyces fructofermentans]|uniref:Uncharacterized protein n=1 Tax=Streptomyces fructofermentans TaxID=152141 RepID=A0A918NFM3_9ACTN|nr:hypothetical protein [Streptomyces fructofermentans]GGX63460.1 hypothetical protein GCM10010515_33910 [Streptomyces fructofermentans]